MDRYQKVPVFDPYTGKASGNEMRKVARHCDFCGKEIVDDDDTNQLVEFEIHEIGGSEESYYYHDFPNLTNPIKFCHRKVFYNHPRFIYCTDECGESCSSNLFTMTRRGDETLESVMQRARIKVVVNLLNEGVSPEELKIESDW